VDPSETTASRLLTRHFVRRLLDNDLISPHADRRESLALAIALVASVPVFLTFFLTIGYLMSFVQLPGPTAISAVSDRFLYIAAAVATSALAALMIWDALSLESRDRAILGPLPIPARTITCAKLAATLTFAGVFALAQNAVPSVLYPGFLTFNLRAMSGQNLMRIVAAHAATTIAAAMFGFFAILTIRGLLRLTLGSNGFRLASGIVQSALVVASVSSLLLAPTVGRATVHDWIRGDRRAPWAARPALSFVGLNEAASCYAVAETPMVMPRRLVLTRAIRERDDAAKAAYRATRPYFAALAHRAWQMLAIASGLAIASFLWNSRRLGDDVAGARTPPRSVLMLRGAAEALTRGDPEAQAGYFFTLQTLARSGPHRIILAVSAAAGATLPLVALVRYGMTRNADAASAPVPLLAIQTMVLLWMIAGFRYAVTVPAELAANWTIRMAWHGDERRFLTGVKRAGLAALVVLPLLLLLPLHVQLLGPVPALVHALCGLLLGIVALDAMFLGYRRMPFACSYLPIESPKVIWPFAVGAFFLVSLGLAAVERRCWQTATSVALLCAALAALAMAVKRLDRRWRRERLPIDFDERPALPTQRLGLSERMGIQ
jgi:hypothetical protein